MSLWFILSSVLVLFLVLKRRVLGPSCVKIRVTKLPLSNSVAPGGITWAGLVCVICVWRKGFWLGGGRGLGGGGGSVGADLRDLCVSCLVGGLNEHRLGQLLPG